MIKNERQYIITKRKRKDLLTSLQMIKSSKERSLLNDIMEKSILSEIENLDKELHEYDIQRS